MKCSYNTGAQAGLAGETQCWFQFLFLLDCIASSKSIKERFQNKSCLLFLLVTHLFSCRNPALLAACKDFMLLNHRIVNVGEDL